MIEIFDINFTEVISLKGANPWVGKLVLFADEDREEDKEYFLSILKTKKLFATDYKVFLTDVDPTQEDHEVSEEDKVNPSKDLKTKLSLISTATKVDDIAEDTIFFIKQFLCDKLNEKLPKVAEDAKADTKLSRFSCKNIGPCFLGTALVILGMTLPSFLENN